MIADFTDEELTAELARRTPLLRHCRSADMQGIGEFCPAKRQNAGPSNFPVRMFRTKSDASRRHGLRLARALAGLEAAAAEARGGAHLQPGKGE